MNIVGDDRGSSVQGFIQLNYVLTVAIEHFSNQGKSKVISPSTNKYLLVEFALVINDAPQKICIEFEHHLPYILLEKQKKPVRILLSRRVSIPCFASWLDLCSASQ